MMAMGYAEARDFTHRNRMCSYIIQHCFIIGYNLENILLLHADEAEKSQHLAQRENNGNGKGFVMMWVQNINICPLCSIKAS